MDKEVLKLANEYRPSMNIEVLHSWAKDMQVALKQALEQPAQQEPVAWPVACVHIKDGCFVGSHRDQSKPFPDGQYGLWPINTPPAQPAPAAAPVQPPQRKPLTGEQLDEIEMREKPRNGPKSMLNFVRAIEAAHGIKENT